jgi:flagellar motor switch protein FliN/FliY
MIIDQNEIEALLTDAASLRDEAEAEASAEKAAAETGATKPAPKTQRKDLFAKASPRLKRVLRVRVPVIVELAADFMSISKIRRLSPGAIIEFEKAVEDDLTLYVRNRSIGRGHAVKIGEHFGIRITEISTKVERIKSFGG